MLIAVIGGKLQGAEAVYLARKAGWKTLVIDKNPKALATGLCDRFLEFEFTMEQQVPENCPGVDLIIPAIEDTVVLTGVKKWAETKHIPLAFDLEAYAITSSKLMSDALFRELNLFVPRPWPDCDFPIVVKPDKASGSQGVEVFNDADTFFYRFPKKEALANRVVQEYLEGPSYSIEVIGQPGHYKPLQVTDLSMDNTYDCKRVQAPTQLSPHQIRAFEKMALTIAEKIKLTGIMDVEVILSDEKLKLLEIDARLPSQTPMAVYGSTRVNMVEMLGHLVLNENRLAPEKKDQKKDWDGEGFSIVEHIQVSDSNISFLGEHIMAQYGPLKLKTDFFGCTEALTSEITMKNKWVATMIFCGRSMDEISARRQRCYEQICEHYGLKKMERLN